MLINCKTSVACGNRDEYFLRNLTGRNMHVKHVNASI